MFNKIVNVQNIQYITSTVLYMKVIYYLNSDALSTPTKLYDIISTLIPTDKTSFGINRFQIKI